MLRLVLGIAIVASLVLLPGVVAHADDADNDDSVERASDLAAPSPRVTRCAALEAVGIGIEPVGAPHGTARIRTTVEAMGYTLVSPTEIAAARQSLGSTAIASPADLWRLTFVSGAARGISARVY